MLSLSLHSFLSVPFHGNSFCSSFVVENSEMSNGI